MQGWHNHGPIACSRRRRAGGAAHGIRRQNDTMPVGLWVHVLLGLAQGAAAGQAGTQSTVNVSGWESSGAGKGALALVQGGRWCTMVQGGKAGRWLSTPGCAPPR